MSRVLELGLMCGLFLLGPVATLVLGNSLILRRFGLHSRMSFPLAATVIGLAAAEGTFIGMALDPRRVDHPWSEVFVTSLLVGLGFALVTLAGTLAFVAAQNLLRQ